MKIVIAVLALWGILFLNPGYAANIYVDGSCANSGDGTAWGCAGSGQRGALNTIQAGINQMSQGDVLRIKSGNYTGGISIYRKDGVSWNAGGYYSVRSDDGAGNLGNVTVKGAVSQCATGVAAACVDNSSYWKFEGITFVGEGARNNDMSFVVEDYSSGGGDGLHLVQCSFQGDPLENALFIHGMDDVLVEGCHVDCTDCAVGDGSLLVVQGPSRSYVSNIVIRGNDIQGTFNNEYASIAVKRGSNTVIENNYIHNFARQAVCIRHSSGTTDIFNNVIQLGGSNWIGGDYVMIFRGMTSCRSGNTGLPGAHQVYVYNNTIDMNGKNVKYGIFGTINDTRDSVIQNNLILGDITSLMFQFGSSVGWDYASYDLCGNTCSSCGSAYVANNNTIRNNVVTGQWSVEEDSGYVPTDPSRNGWTLSNNVQGVGAGVIQQQGRAPSPYYQLSRNLDTYATTSGPKPGQDYLGNSRASRPDIGALEYSTGAVDTVPPIAPGGVKAVTQ